LWPGLVLLGVGVGGLSPGVDHALSANNRLCVNIEVRGSHVRLPFFAMARAIHGGVEVREVAPDDVPALIACVRRCYAETYTER